VWFFGALIVGQVTELVEAFPEWWTEMRGRLEARWPQVVEWINTNPWGQRLREQVTSHQDELFQGLQLIGG
ncbi:MAG: hypothetical protein GWM88_07420, partial [Pseudomonadales bacterium]|nr:hypothetical protein [Pseudomonadales bacterium]NIX07842.1 hypothetical protein [Pseudomonadales bacterium]